MDNQGAAAQAVTQTMPSTAQARIISAALELFAQNGVGGTSLQMIADAIGVTKAAVYHQYNTKDEIVLAAAKLSWKGLTRLFVPPRLSHRERGLVRRW